MLVECEIPRLRVYLCLQSFWNYVELALFLILSTILAMTAYRFYLLFATSAKRRSLRKLDYISFHSIAKFEEVSCPYLPFTLIYLA